MDNLNTGLITGSAKTSKNTVKINFGSRCFPGQKIPMVATAYQSIFKTVIIYIAVLHVFFTIV